MTGLRLTPGSPFMNKNSLLTEMPPVLMAGACFPRAVARALLAGARLVSWAAGLLRIFGVAGCCQVLAPLAKFAVGPVGSVLAGAVGRVTDDEKEAVKPVAEATLAATRASSFKRWIQRWRGSRDSTSELLIPSEQGSIVGKGFRCSLGFEASVLAERRLARRGTEASEGTAPEGP